MFIGVYSVFFLHVYYLYLFVAVKLSPYCLWCDMLVSFGSFVYSIKSIKLNRQFPVRRGLSVTSDVLVPLDTHLQNLSLLVPCFPKGCRHRAR